MDFVTKRKNLPIAGCVLATVMAWPVAIYSQAWHTTLESAASLPDLLVAQSQLEVEHRDIASRHPAFQQANVVASAQGLAQT